MKILQINFYDMFSTGNIMLNIARVSRERGYVATTASKKMKMSTDRHRKDDNHIYIGNRVENTLHRYFSWITDLQDCGTVFGTLKLVYQIERYKPDVVHLHDVLGWYLNIDILFKYLKKKNIPIVWTFHDCWAFTGRCVYFDAVGCDRWKTGCGQCPQKGYMPGSWYFDLSSWNFKRKKRLFAKLQNLTIVTPSEWLKTLVGESFLSSYNTLVINNGIDLCGFKPTRGAIYDGIVKENKKIVLGVAATWSERKGLNDLIRLSVDLGSDYIVYIVGISEDQLPKKSINIRCITRTHSVKDLAEIYSAATVYVNPTYEDNFPTVNLEALACGIPIVTYKTGGSPESVDDKTGRVVEKGDYEALKLAVIDICNTSKNEFYNECINKSKQYDMNDRFNDYVDLYESIISLNKNEK